MPFNFNGKQFFVMKDVEIFDKNNVVFLDSYGEKIINSFNSAKKEKKNLLKENNKNKEYQVGNILQIENEEKVIVDIYDNYLILADYDRNTCAVSKDDKYKIVSNLEKEIVKAMLRTIDYDDIKRRNILLGYKKR